MSITLSSLSSDQLRRAADLKEQIEALNKELASFLGAPASIPAKAPKRRGMSAAGRAAVAAAQKARWAKVAPDRDLKKASQDNKKIRHKESKRTMSAAAKAKISAAAKARWAKIKGAKPTPEAPAKKRTMSAAGRARISAAAKARWAKVKGAGKKRL
jgi:hypothetical protein